MLGKLKELENLSYDEMMELKTALLAYDLGLNSNEITLEEIDNVESAIEFYYDTDDLTFFVDERIIDNYNESKEDEEE